MSTQQFMYLSRIMLDRSRILPSASKIPEITGQNANQMKQETESGEFSVCGLSAGRDFPGCSKVRENPASERVQMGCDPSAERFQVRPWASRREGESPLDVSRSPSREEAPNGLWVLLRYASRGKRL